MRRLLAICAIVTSTSVCAGAEGAVPNPHEASGVQGEVLEVKNVESYTYLRLKNQGGEFWAAVTRAAVRKGATVTLENVTVMNNFESKSLKRTFPTILFGTLRSAEPIATHLVGSAYPTRAKMTVSSDIRVPRASGDNARTVAEIVNNSTELKDQTVQVRGKVVKYNPEIMGKNWVHLRDGSGSSVDNSNDILVTTTNETRVGDVVTAKGVVRIDKDFGAGYSYKVLIEDATLQ